MMMKSITLILLTTIVRQGCSMPTMATNSVLDTNSTPNSAQDILLDSLIAKLFKKRIQGLLNDNMRRSVADLDDKNGFFPPDLYSDIGRNERRMGKEKKSKDNNNNFAMLAGSWIRERQDSLPTTKSSLAKSFHTERYSIADLFTDATTTTATTPR